MFAKYNYQFKIVFIGFINLICINFLIQLFFQINICSDSLNYIEAAQFLYYDFSVHQYRPVLFSFIIGFPLLFSDAIQNLIYFGYFINIVCWFGTCMLIFTILTTISSEKLAFKMAVVFLFLFGNLALVFQLLTETIFSFIVVLAFYFFIKYKQTNAFKFLSFFITLFIFSMLIKPSSMIFAFFLLFYFAKTLFKNYKSKYMICIVISIFFVGVQCMGNYKKYGNFKLSYIDSITYYNYLGTKAAFLEKRVELKDFGPNYRNKYIYSLSPKEANEVATNDFYKQFTSNFDNLIKAYLYNLRYNATGGSSTIKFSKNNSKSLFFNGSQNILFVFSKIQNVILTFLGLLIFCIILFRFKKSDESLILISMFVAYTIFISGISMAQGDRFHVVIFPFVLILIGSLFQLNYSQFKNSFSKFFNFFKI